MQSYLHALSEEAEDPRSSFQRLKESQQKELQTLLGACRKDLEELMTSVTKYKSLGKSNPRTRDRIGFTKSKQADIRDRITTHSNRLQRLLDVATLVAVSRIEGHAEAHVLSLSDIRVKLDRIHDDLRSGRRAATVLTDADGMDQVEAEILLHGTTEDDVDLRSEISDWVTRVRIHGDIETMIHQMADHELKIREDPPADQAVSVGTVEDTDADSSHVIEHGEHAESHVSAQDTSGTTSGDDDAQAINDRQSEEVSDGTLDHPLILDLTRSNAIKTNMYDESRHSQCSLRHGTSGPRSHPSYAHVVEVSLGPEERSTETMRNFLVLSRGPVIAGQGSNLSRTPFGLRIAPNTPNGYRIRHLGLGNHNTSNAEDIIFEVVGAKHHKR